MKKLLYILLFLQIICGLYVFFMLIGNTPFYAVISALIALLEITLTVAVIQNTDGIEQLSDETVWLKAKLKELEDKVNPYDLTEVTAPAASHGDAAYGTWECVKCGTVNKAGTDTCQNCGAVYSAEINPTSNPCAKKKPKMSRFVK